MTRLSQCLTCGATINLEYGKDNYAEHQGHAGTPNDPRAPGEYDDICDECQAKKLDP